MPGGGGRSSRDLPLNLDWIWDCERKVWLPERPRQRDDEELMGEMDLGEEMEKNFMKSLNWAKLGFRCASGVLLRQSANELSVRQCVTTPRQLPPSESEALNNSAGHVSVT